MPTIPETPPMGVLTRSTPTPDGEGAPDQNRGSVLMSGPDPEKQGRKRRRAWPESSSSLDGGAGLCDNNLTMKDPTHSPITDPLKEAVIKSGMAFKALARETGVQRSSIQRFVDGRQSIRLDVADRLAAYFGLELVERGRK